MKSIFNTESSATASCCLTYHRWYRDIMWRDNTYVRLGLQSAVSGPKKEPHAQSMALHAPHASTKHSADSNTAHSQHTPSPYSLHIKHTDSMLMLHRKTQPLQHTFCRPGSAGGVVPCRALPRQGPRRSGFRATQGPCCSHRYRPI